MAPSTSLVSSAPINLLANSRQQSRVICTTIAPFLIFGILIRRRHFHGVSLAHCCEFPTYADQTMESEGCIMPRGLSQSIRGLRLIIVVDTSFIQRRTWSLSSDFNITHLFPLRLLLRLVPLTHPILHCLHNAPCTTLPVFSLELADGKGLETLGDQRATPRYSSSAV
ncbi:hypothetical protein B0H12DRAFT_429017 [Mycena haematopus]|nr:hypothetical protein B0H12DRAFT_429017 [Mycena haematopus]